MFFLQITANFRYPQISNKTWYVFYLIHRVQNLKIPIHLLQVDQFVCSPCVTKILKIKVPNTSRDH